MGFNQKNLSLKQHFKHELGGYKMDEDIEKEEETESNIRHRNYSEEMEVLESSILNGDIQ